MVNLKEIVKEARKHLETFNDDKAYAPEKVFREMILNGADNIKLNDCQGSGTYAHTLKYEGITFILATDKEIVVN